MQTQSNITQFNPEIQAFSPDSDSLKSPSAAPASVAFTTASHQLPTDNDPVPHSSGSVSPTANHQPPSANFALRSPLKRKLRGDSAFAELTSEQHAQLQHWLSTNTYDQVVKLVAQPAPEGFGIHTHTNSLFRYFHQHLADDAFPR